MAITNLPPAWVQFASDGLAHVRAVAREACPVVVVDGKMRAMQIRLGAAPGFANVSCDLTLSPQTQSASIDGRPMPILTHSPHKIAVIGDTGCRIKGLTVQGCNDPAAWPFPVIAADVAREKPDLIIHVGDFFYRETPCPPFVSACAGSPYGDAWDAWDADWFAPAAPLFSAAPMVLLRGNHEECKRGGKGWVRYLSPDPNPSCLDDEGPYAVQVGPLRLIVFDDSVADDVFATPEQSAHYREQLRRAASLASGETWLLLHRPIYGAVEVAGVFTFTNATMMSAAAPGDPLEPFSAILSGHLHTFEAIDPEGRPPQIVNGMSGDNLDDRVKAGIVGKIVMNRKVTAAFVDAQFGYGIYEAVPGGWNITVKAPGGKVRSTCALRARVVRCSAA